MKNEEPPHAKRRGWLKNNNSPGDPSKAPRCNAQTRSKSKCKSPAMKNGRCRMHGGKSTGAKTEHGKNILKIINKTHGLYSKEHLFYRKNVLTFYKKIK